jgi:hypothetical protein
MEPELCVMGEVLLDSIPTKQTELLSTKQVVKLVKRDQLDDAFLMLINEDTSIQEVLSSDDPLLAKSSWKLSSRPQAENCVGSAQRSI